MHELTTLGFGPFFQQQLVDDNTSGETICARIASEHTGCYEVWSDRGKGLARLAGRLLHSLGEEGLPGVGDWVTPGSETGSPSTLRRARQERSHRAIEI